MKLIPVRNLLATGLACLAMGIGPITPVAHAEDEAVPEVEVFTQGNFAAAVIALAGGQALFGQGTMTELQAAQKLAELGLTPDGGWDVEQEVTVDHLCQSYKNLYAAQLAKSRAPAEGEEGEDVSKPEALDCSSMSMDQITSAIVDVIREAIADVREERQPVSATGRLWR